MRTPIPGTVARGQLQEQPEFYTGMDSSGSFIASNPINSDSELLQRGKHEFEIYCTPCHGSSGDGQGMLSTIAGVRTANLHEERLREVPDGQLFDTITNGFGLMPGYRYPLHPADRWAVVAYVRQLQSQTQ